MESKQRFRATVHAGRTYFKDGKSTGKVYTNKHNDRNFNISNADHINAKKISYNLHYIADENGKIIPKPADITYADWEEKMYECYYAEWLKKQNERHIQARHEDRIRSMKDVITSARQAPREEILQIGNFTNKCNDEEAFIDVVNDYVIALQKRYPAIRILNYSIHRDEEAAEKASSIHAHLRTCFLHQTADGNFEPNQTQALVSMGIEAPDPNKKIDRWNNGMVTFTAQCRELYISIAQQHGFEIETEPETPGKRTLNKQEYLTKVFEEQTQALQAEKEELVSEAAVIAAERDGLARQVVALEEETGRLKGMLRRLKAIFAPINELFVKLSHIHLWDDKTVLDAVVEDARCEGVIDALEALEIEDLGH